MAPTICSTEPSLTLCGYTPLVQLRREKRWTAGALALLLAVQGAGTAFGGTIHLADSLLAPPSGNITLSDDIVLDNAVILDSQFVFNSQVNAGIYAFNGAVTGPGSLVMSSCGLLTLASSNSFAGGITFGACPTGSGMDQMLVINSPAALGIGPLSFVTNRSAYFQFNMQPGSSTILSNPMNISNNVFFGAAGASAGQTVTINQINSGNCTLRLDQTQTPIPDLVWSVGSLQINGSLSLTSSGNSANFTIGSGNPSSWSRSFFSYTPTVVLGSVQMTPGSTLTLSNVGSAHLTQPTGTSGTLSDSGVLTIEGNGALNCKAVLGGLNIATAGLWGTGNITFSAYIPTYTLSNPAALTGTQAAALLQTRATVYLNCDNIQNLWSLRAGSSFVIPNSTSPTGTVLSESGTLILSGASLTGHGVLQPMPGSQLLLLADYPSATLGDSSGTLQISALVIGIGNVTSNAVNLRLTNPDNYFLGTLTLNGRLTIDTPSAVNGATLALGNNGEMFIGHPGQTDPISVDNPLVAAYNRPPIEVYSPTNFRNVTLSHASLIVNAIFNAPQGTTPISIGDLTMNGYSQISVTSYYFLTPKSTVPHPYSPLINIQNLNQLGSDAAIDLETCGSPLLITGNITATSSIILRASTILEADVAPSTQSFSVRGGLTACGDIPRPLILSGGPLTPGSMPDPSNSPGNLSVDSLVCQGGLVWDLDQPDTLASPFNDFLFDRGNLSLTGGSLVVKPGPDFEPGRYILMTYSGTLMMGINITQLPNYKMTWDTTTPGQLAVIVTPEPGMALVLATPLLWFTRRGWTTRRRR